MRRQWPLYFALVFHWLEVLIALSPQKNTRTNPTVLCENWGLQCDKELNLQSLERELKFCCDYSQENWSFLSVKELKHSKSGFKISIIMLNDNCTCVDLKNSYRSSFKVGTSLLQFLWPSLRGWRHHKCRNNRQVACCYTNDHFNQFWRTWSHLSCAALLKFRVITMRKPPKRRPL